VAFSISGAEMATTNPFDITAPTVTSGMVSNAATGTTTPAVATNPYTSSAVFNPATTSTYNPSSTFANGYDASTYDPTKWNVDSNQTVQGQINNVIAADLDAAGKDRRSAADEPTRVD
jgi:hypothetical protein